MFVVLDFKNLDFGFVWDLEIRVWNFKTACKRLLQKKCFRQ